jgi:GNAT superfamily N-acetyltransferase
MTLRLVRADTAAAWGEARRLIEEYACSLNLDLSFQNFADELEHLPSEYGPPRGAFLLAQDDGLAIGGVGLRAFSGSTGEIKRLYVVPAGRGHGVGRALMLGVLASARELGYERLLLDTLPSMRDAQALYRSLGFRPIPAYRFNPVEGTAFFALDLP